MSEVMFPLTCDTGKVTPVPLKNFPFAGPSAFTAEWKLVYRFRGEHRIMKGLSLVRALEEMRELGGRINPVKKNRDHQFLAGLTRGW